jgi:hypothetical protein
MSLRSAILILAMVVAVTAAGQQKPSPTQSDKPNSVCKMTHEDYEVFSGLLDGLGGPEDPEEAWQGKEFLIISMTEAPGIIESQWGKWGFRSKSKAAPSAVTVKDFHKKAKLSCPLQQSLRTTHAYKFLADKELEAMFTLGSSGWEYFDQKFPNAGGFWSFSSPGYNEQHTEALLSVSHSCGGLCGTGHLYLLRKENGKWKVKNRLMLWIS